MSYLPEPSLTPKEPKVALHCDLCWGEIYEGEEYYRFETYCSTMRTLCFCESCARAARRTAGEQEEDD